jgi:hypothetical protein
MSRLKHEEKTQQQHTNDYFRVLGILTGTNAKEDILTSQEIINLREIKNIIYEITTERTRGIYDDRWTIDDDEEYNYLIRELYNPIVIALYAIGTTTENLKQELLEYKLDLHELKDCLRNTHIQNLLKQHKLDIPALALVTQETFLCFNFPVIIEALQTGAISLAKILSVSDSEKLFELVARAAQLIKTNDPKQMSFSDHYLSTYPKFNWDTTLLLNAKKNEDKAPGFASLFDSSTTVPINTSTFSVTPKFS